MSNSALLAHLATGATHVCYCWSILRQDGFAIGFTDHDALIRFEGIDFNPSAGLSARALASTTGLSVNNTEALGILQDDAITEADIEAARYDGASVTIWQVQWDAPEVRKVQFKGTIGEVTRSSGGFQAELRGLTEALNQPQGRSYLTNCSAVLGDQRCRVDTADPKFTTLLSAQAITDGQVFHFAEIAAYQGRWFEGGFLEVTSGRVKGLSGVIKLDQPEVMGRSITLWQPIPIAVDVGDTLRLIAGCDKRDTTCRAKFDNLINFQGFPDIPGEAWMVSVPRRDGTNSGGSRR